MNVRQYPSKEELYDIYVLEDKTMKEISKQYNISVGKVHQLITQYKIKPKNRKTNKKWCQRISESKKGVPNYKNRGRKISEERKEKLRILKSNGIGKKIKTTSGYIKIYFPDHPKSDKRGYILEHDLIMECNIGRWLNKDEVVHHINKIRDDNRIENLKLMTRGEHTQYHRLLKLGRNDDLSM